MEIKKLVPKQLLQWRDKELEGGVKALPKIVKPVERRVPCGECNRPILMFYNPEGFCRKCKRLRARRTLRMSNRILRGTL